MSIAPTKCLSSCQRRPGQSRLGQRVNTDPSALTVGVSQTGHRFGWLRRRRPVAALGHVRRRREHLRDHVAGAQHDHLLAVADVLAREVLLVVERRQLDRHAADVDRLEHRVRVQIAELPGIPADLLERRDRGRRRELPRDRPPRLASDHAEPALELDLVDLDDDAVDLELERSAALLPRPALGDHVLLVVNLRHVGMHRETVLRSHSSASQWAANVIPSVAPIA